MTVASEPTPSGLAELAELAAGWRTAFDHDGAFWRRFAYVGAAHGPPWFRRYTPAAFGALACAALPVQRGNVVKNWRRLGLARTALEAHQGAFRTFTAFAECLTDGLESVSRGVDGVTLDSPANHPFAAQLAKGRGMVLLTAHTGSWDVVGRLIGRRHSAPVTMVMTREPNASTRGFAEANQVRPGDRDFEVAYVGGDSLSALPLAAALRKGRIVAIQFDRVPRGAASLTAPFFGIQQRFAVGPFRLAQLTGAPLIAAFTRRIGHRAYAVDIPQALEIPRARGADSEAIVKATMAQVAADFEAFVRKHPTQWFQFEDLDPGAV